MHIPAYRWNRPTWVMISCQGLITVWAKTGDQGHNMPQNGCFGGFVLRFLFAMTHRDRGQITRILKLFEADGYSFSPVWVRSCLVMLNFVLNVSAQMEQIWGFSSAWVRSCAAAWPFWPNFFTGACKRHFPLLVPAYGTLLATRLQ